MRTGPDDLVESLISKVIFWTEFEFDVDLVYLNCINLKDNCNQVTGSDRGIDLTSEQHREVASVAEELKKYCVSEPVKCPLIFGGNFTVLAIEF